jgi:hypothetical protein
MAGKGPLNWTTKVKAKTTAQECIGMLQDHGARRAGLVMDNKQPSGLEFQIETRWGLRQYALPVDVSSEEARRVAVGEAFMDAVDPGWWREDIERAIDLGDFDMSRPDACVLAQRCPLEVLAEHVGALNAGSLLDSDMDEAYFVNAVRLSAGAVRDDETLTEWATAHGFTGNADELPGLTAEWKRVITRRRKASGR